jgi:alpha-aminoadipate/glutamate carrier protein LysW
MPTIGCPECHEDVFVDADSEQGDIFSCDECGVNLELVGLDPIEVDVTTKKGGGDDDYDNYNDYDDDGF